MPLAPTVSAKGSPAQSDRYLYVANYPGIGVYSLRNLQLARTIVIDSNSYGPQSVVVDSNGYVYAAACGSGCYAFGFAPGSSQAACTYDTSDGGGSLTLSGGGSLAIALPAYTFYLFHNAQIDEYAPSCGKIKRTIVESQQDQGRSISPVAFDRSGDLYVGMQSSNSVAIYKPGHTHPSQRITEDINFPIGLAFGPSGNLYVLNGADSTVTVYAPSGKLLRTIATSVASASLFALDSSGDLYVGNSQLVAVYNPGSIKCAYTITKGISGADAIALDSPDRLYVANTGTNSVTAYDRGSAKPFETITKGLSVPRSLAVGPK